MVGRKATNRPRGAPGGALRPHRSRQTTGARRTDPSIEVRFRLWFSSPAGQLLGPGRARLLEALDEAGSISAAARALGMSYRKAWRLTDNVNRAAAAPLVERSRGGAGGGGARLTPFGRSMLRAFRALEQELAAVCDRHLAGLPVEPSPTARPTARGGRRGGS